MAKNNKIVKYKKPLSINIGVVIFAIIIIYVLFNLFVYLTSDQIAEYEVQQGTIATNNIYKGLIIRDEEIVNTEQSGLINYYLRNGSRASVNDVIYSVDTDGSISNEITSAAKDGSTLSTAELNNLSEKIDTFTSTYYPNDFYDVYSFKNDINSQLSQTLNTTALNDLSDRVNTAIGNGTFFKNTTATPGIVLYYVDGLEGLTVDGFTPDKLDPTTYSKTTLNTRTEVAAGDPAYKLVKSENWNIIISISSSLADQLSEDSYIKVRFCKDNQTATAAYSILKKDDNYYLNLAFTNSMVRYASERYMNIELLLDEQSGLKIPNSAITEKDFYAVPKEYFTQGDDSSDYSLLVQTSNGDKKSVELVTPTIYYETDTAFYVDDETVKSGDSVVKNDSSSTYTIGTDTATLQGVYNINKGYAVFKQINMIYQNEEYAIVETGTAYGVALYDHIALDGSKVQEDQLVIK